MTFHVRTTVFEGPLDLLLQLITRHQVEISEVGITGVVNEYVAFIEEMESLDLEVTSEFLLIAATLIQLKTRSLLPSGGGMDMDEELSLIEERDRLLSRLLACVTFKDVAAVLQRRLQEHSRFVPRVSGIDQKIAPSHEGVTVPVNASGLARIAAQTFFRVDPDVDLDHFDLGLPSVEHAIDDLRSRVELQAVSSFDDLVDHCSTTLEVAAYFLALLELARWGLVRVSQDDWMSKITVTHLGGDQVDLTSEWAR
jgi:segregation and condensation protein A